MLWVRAEVLTIPSFFVYYVLTSLHYNIYKERRVTMQEIRLKNLGLELAQAIKQKIEGEKAQDAKDVGMLSEENTEDEQERTAK